MSVSITFEPSGLSGVVAEGTYLIDAARRMGVSLGTGCTIGKAECPSCLISVKTGSNNLRPNRRRTKTSQCRRPDHSLRLACQVKLEYPGEVVVMASAHKTGPGPSPRDTAAEVRKEFGALPLSQKLATLVQLEAITMSQALDTAMEKPLAFGAKQWTRS